MITNACNLTCGGCNQLCGHIPKERLFFITIEELRRMIKILGVHPSKTIILFGGEPTVHPLWDDLLRETQEFPDTHFVIFTNGRTGPPPNESNHSWVCSPKDRQTVGNFVPTALAPRDIIGIQDVDYYWKLAKKDCYIYRKCHPTVYNNRAYFCQNAGAFDSAAREDHGWPVEEGKYPFDHTDEEIAEQASHFCYRCVFCIWDKHHETLPKQGINSPTLVTLSNVAILKPRLSQLSNHPKCP